MSTKKSANSMESRVFHRKKTCILWIRVSVSLWKWITVLGNSTVKPLGKSLEKLLQLPTGKPPYLQLTPPPLLVSTFGEKKIRHPYQYPCIFFKKIDFFLVVSTFRNFIGDFPDGNPNKKTDWPEILFSGFS